MPELSAAELATRHEGLGATDIVELCGLAPWEGAGPWRVWNQKLGITPPTEATEEMRWGHVQERVIATWYVDNVGPFEIPKGGTVHPDHSFIWATLDGICPERTVEIKNVSGFMCKDWDASSPDGVPHYVRAQVMVGMACSGRKECHVVASLAGRPPELWTVRYDAELAELLVGRAVNFWKRVQAQRGANAEAPGGLAEVNYEPPLDASDACREYLRRKYPVDERGWLVPLPAKMAELDGIMRARADAARAGKDAEVAVKAFDTQLLAAIGPHRGYEGDGHKMTWRVDRNGVRRSRFTVTGGSDE
jgi:putative phage-type endonuclease